MSETSLADLVGTVSQRRPAARPAKFDDEPEYRAFTFGRVGARSQPRFEICKCDGYQLMLAYVDLKTVETMNAANGFVLGFLGFKVAIQGQNLLPCYRYLFTERIDAIVEASRRIGAVNRSDGAIGDGHKSGRLTADQKSAIDSHTALNGCRCSLLSAAEPAHMLPSGCKASLRGVDAAEANKPII